MDRDDATHLLLSAQRFTSPRCPDRSRRADPPALARTPRPVRRPSRRRADRRRARAVGGRAGRRARDAQRHRRAARGPQRSVRRPGFRSQGALHAGHDLDARREPRWRQGTDASRTRSATSNGVPTSWWSSACCRCCAPALLDSDGGAEAEARRILGDSGAGGRSADGADTVDTPDDDVRAAALDTIGRWRMVVEDPFLSPDGREVARGVVRSCEALAVSPDLTDRAPSYTRPPVRLAGVMRGLRLGNRCRHDVHGCRVVPRGQRRGVPAGDVPERRPFGHLRRRATICSSPAPPNVGAPASRTGSPVSSSGDSAIPCRSCCPGSPYHADRLTALMARWVVDSVTEQVGERTGFAS